MVEGHEHEIVKDLVTHLMGVPWELEKILCGD